MDPTQDTAKPSIFQPARLMTLGVFLLVLGTGILLNWHSLTDIDIWFHLRSGRDLMAGEGLGGVNRYSFTEPDHPWLNHEWLFQVGTAALGPSDSPETLDVTRWNILRTALGLVLLLTLTWAGGLWRRAGAAAVWTGLACLLGLLMLWTRLTLRPELVSYPCFILLVVSAERIASSSSAGISRSWKSRVLGPEGLALMITLFWAQCHGFVALAPAILILAALLGPLEGKWRGFPPRDKSSIRVPWLVALASVAVLALTPNGVEGLLFPLRALGQFSGDGVDLRSTVSELVPLLQSPGSLDWTIKAYLASLVLGGLWIVLRWRDVGLLRIALFLLAAVAAWTSQRSLGLYAITFVLLQGAPAHRASWLLPRLPRPIPPRAVLLGGLGLLLVACLLWWPAIVSDDFYLHEGVGRRFGGGTNPARFPSGPVGGLAGADRYFANLDAAAFALAHAPGAIYIDGRTEAYSPALWEEYLRIKSGGDQALDLLAGRRVEAVCLATSNPAFRSLTRTLWNSNLWSLARADGAGLLFVPQRRNAVALSDTVIVRQAMARLEKETSGGPATRRADQHLALSRLASLVGDAKAAEAHLTRGLGLKPDHPTLHHNLGNQLMGRNDFGEAVGHFEAALALNPRLAGSALNAGVCHSRLGDREAARRFFRRAVAIDSRNFEAWMNLAITERSLGNQGSARKAAAKARALRPRDRGVIDLQRRLGS